MTLFCVVIIITTAVHSSRLQLEESLVCGGRRWGEVERKKILRLHWDASELDDADVISRTRLTMILIVIHSQQLMNEIRLYL